MKSKKITDALFSNVGGKLKLVAVIVFYVMLIGGVVGGIILMIADDDLAAFGLITLAAGLLLSWISALPLYAFGQLVENSDKIKNAVTGTPEQVDSAVKTDAPASESAQPSEKEKKAAQLKAWRDADLITEEEYQAKLSTL